MFHIKQMVVMHTLNVSASMAKSIVASMERSGVNEHSATLREYVVAAGAAYADQRDRDAEQQRSAG